MSISPSRFFIRAGSSGSVRPSTQQTVIFVSDRLPTTDSSSRSSGVRRWRRIRLVFVRSVSVNASFAPLTVFSASGADGERFSPVFTSHRKRLPSLRKENHAEPIYQQLCRLVRAGSLLHRRAPDKPPLGSHKKRLLRAPPAAPHVTAARIKVRNVPTGGQPVEKENLQLVSAGYHLPRLKIRCPRKSRRQHLPIDHTFHLMGIIVPLPGKNYTVLFASGLQI